METLQAIISQSIQFIYEMTAAIGLPSYGFAIIVFSVFIKVLLMPLTIKQIKGMKIMQELQPKVQQIQKKHKDDKQKAQAQIMELYKEYNANPFSGCWPLLVQLPILFALFRSLTVFFDPVLAPSYVNLEHTSFLWVSNLGSPDPYKILPVLVAAGTFIQQKITMGATIEQNPNQKFFLYLMPLFIGWISLTFPAALALYWITYSVMGIAEHILIRKPMTAKEEAAKK